MAVNLPSKCPNPECRNDPPSGASYCPHCGTPLNGIMHSSEEITVDDGKSAIEKTSGLTIRVESLDDDYISYSVRLPRHPRMLAEEQSCAEVIRYSAGSDGIYEVKLLDINSYDGRATFLVTKRGA